MQGVVGSMAVDRGRVGVLSLAVLAITFLLCQTAGAALPDEDPWGGIRCETGEGLGQCRVPRGIAADPKNGHIFVADQTNQRVNEFNALGQFVKAWGWDVVVGGGTEFEICKVGDTCKSGTEGSGPGQFSAPQGVALDNSGNIYVVDFSNSRVQKFDPAGNFLLAFGSPGAGPGQFGAWSVSSFIAIDPADNVYVGDVERIQRFNTTGAYQDECAVPSGQTVQSLAVDSTGILYAVYSGEAGVHKLAYVGGGACEELDRFDMPALPEGVNRPSAVAVDTKGNVIAFGATACCAGQDNLNPVIEFDSKGKVIAEFGKGEYNTSTGLATNLCAGSDPPGNLYVSNSNFSKSFIRVYGTDPVGCFKARTLPPTSVEETSATLNGSVNPSGEAVSECFFEFGPTTAYGQKLECTPKASEIGTGSTPVPVHFDIGPLQKATAYHYRLIAKVGAETEIGSDVEFKTKGPPVITDEHVVSVIQSEATLKALINPEGLPTSCHFDYGTTPTYGQSTPSQSLGKDREVHVALVNLKGLVPGTTYQWRIVCANSSGSSESGDHALSTYLPFASESGCPNQAFRTEASALLSDCRAYEMVSPVDKNGGDIVRGSFSPGDPDGYTQATPEGNKITYTSLSPFGELSSAVNFNQYLSARSERGEPGEGWSSQGIRPPVVGHNVIKASVGLNLQRQYMAFTPDLCYGWLMDEQTPPLSLDAIDGYPNLFRRHNCEPGEGELEVLTDVVPPKGTPLEYIDKHLSLQGASADGSHALFVAKAKLTPEAPEEGSYKLYDSFGGAIHLVSIVPDKGLGDPTPGDGKGVPSRGELGAAQGWQANLVSAVSEDGSRVYWSNGELYLRIHPEQGAVEGECTTPAKACTIRVGGGLFWAASPDGSKAIYTEGGKLLEFDLGRFEAKEKASLPIAKGVEGVAGASEDLSHVYFVSREALDGGPAGQPNLYLAEGGSVSFIATLSEKDVGEKELGANAVPYDVVETRPYYRATRVSADGEAIAFNSRAPLTGYDNTDTASGKAAVEVFVYQAGSDELHCASCNPSEARPQVVPEMHESYAFPWDPGLRVRKVPAAAFLPTWEQPTYASRPLSADGSRLFFNSYDALLPRDTNGQMDVYEWEAAGTGRCSKTKGNPSYFPQRGGCVYLISSGESSYESEFWEASANGSDVFFTTESSLVPPDPGSIDLYDARVGGGFKYPVAKPPCEGEACQSPPPAPDHPTPASSASPGNGNVDNKGSGGGGPNCGALSRKAKHLSAAARKAGGSTPKGQRLSHKAKQLASQANRCRARQRRAK